MSLDPDAIPIPTDSELSRVRALLEAIGGTSVIWGAASLLDVLTAEHRMRAERKATERIVHVTWVLTIATAVLALATIGLIFATLAA